MFIEIQEYRNIRQEYQKPINNTEKTIEGKVGKKLFPANGSKLKISEKTINTLDFEVLTHNDKTLPVMLGYYSYNPSHDNKNINDKRYCEVLHELDGFYWKDLKNTQQNRTKIFNKIIKELISSKFKKGLNFFYNIRYDMMILFSLLPIEKLWELYTTNEINWELETDKGIEEITISQIPTKTFSIKRERKAGKRKFKDIYKFYDLAVHTGESLENAVENWLGISEVKDGFDTAEVFNNKDKLDEVYQEAVDYCKRDCKYTAILGAEVKKHFEDMEIPFNSPISSASLFKAYFSYHYNNVPKGEYTKTQNGTKNRSDKKYYELFGENYAVDKMAIKGFFGGHFEMFKRGLFKNALGLDVDSLYPYVMTKLPNLEFCDIAYIREDLKTYEGKTKHEWINESDWAVINCKIWLREDTNIPVIPFEMKINTDDGIKKKIGRPIPRGQKVSITKQMYDFLMNEYNDSNGDSYVEKIELLDMFSIKEGEEHSEDNRPFDFYEELFNHRAELKKLMKKGEISKDDKRELIIKIILNAGFGVCAESFEDVEITFDEEFNEELTEEISKVGKFWRGFLAMHITELSRLLMYENIFKAGIENEVIGIATDCIYVTQQGRENFLKYADLTPEKKLGTFSIEHDGDMLVVGNGIYLFWEKQHLCFVDPKTHEWKDPEGNVITHEEAVKLRDIKYTHAEDDNINFTTRGFNEKQFPNLFKLYYNNNDLIYEDKVEINNKRPKTTGDIRHDILKEIEKLIGEENEEGELVQANIGRFDTEVKMCNVNMDYSRLWNKKYNNFLHCFEEQTFSNPFQLPEEI